MAEGRTANEILDAAGVRAGLVVHLGCGDGKLTGALRVADGYVVHGLDRDAANVAAAREHLTATGLNGKVTVSELQGDRLPYTEDLVNLIVAAGPTGIAKKEMLRVLVPGGVLIFLQPSASSLQPFTKPWPDELDEWTHFLHAADGNAVSRDRRVGTPDRLRWIADPKYSRHHDEVLALSAMVTGGGRLFSIVDEAPRSTFHPLIGGQFFLIARDAFNGIELWRKPIKDWGWQSWGARQNVRFSQPIQLPKRMVVDRDRLYVTLGWNAPISVLDAVTGKVVKVLDQGTFADEMLLIDGKMVLSVYNQAVKPKPHPVAKGHRGTVSQQAAMKKRIRVLDPDSGEIAWESEWLNALKGRYDAVAPQTHLELTVRAGRVFAITSEEILCYALADGKELWSRQRPEHPVHHMHLGVSMSDNCTVLADDERLYVVQPVGKLRNNFHTIPCDLYCYDAAAGKQLWMLKRKIGSFAWGIHADLFLIDGKLWTHEHFENPMKGADPVNQESINYALVAIDAKTGEIERRIDTKRIFNVRHHHRCYRNNATERFVFAGRRGTELIDLKNGELHISHWLRGECRFGMVPANGLIYAPPNPCSCHARIKVNGMLALAAGTPPPVVIEGRLLKGPAYGAVTVLDAGPADWPMYRGGPRRQGYTGQVIDELSPRWRKHPACEYAGKGKLEARPTGKMSSAARLTQASCVGGQMFVACTDTHQIKALNLDDGSECWQFTADGRIDSSPTFSRGYLLFGTASGYVYCLRAEDGALAWRFRAAPSECRILAREQPESAWPVRGSVLVQDGLAYVVAGRSSYLDGGLHKFLLDVATGEIRTEGLKTSEHSNKTRPYSAQTQDADGALNQILVSDGIRVHLQNAPLFDSDPPATPVKPFLMATCGMLDDWMFNRFGWGVVGHSGVTGTQIVHDDDTAYATRATRTFNRSNTFTVGSGYTLMAVPLLQRSETYAQSDKNAFASLGYRAPKVEPKWQRKIPVRGQAMLLTKNALLVAGFPDEISEDDPYATFEGRRGAKLLIIDRQTGETLSEMPLEAPPIWDGLSLAKGCLLVALSNGKLRCFNAR